MVTTPYLIIYMLIFISPMIAITLITYFGFAKVEDMGGWRENNIQKPEIRTDLACSDNFVKIEIFNTGNHIKSDNLKRIFEPYFTTREEEGTGIGLYICKMIIENKFQGNITAKNYENGVLFTITAKKTAK